MTKEEYIAFIKKEIDWLYLHSPRSDERQHIICVLEWSIQQLYPIDPTKVND